MKQFIMDCYEITESYDRDSQHIAFVSNPSLAQKVVDKQKGYRSYRPYKKIITIFETAEEMEENSKQNLRKSALSKLTPAEIDALGIK